MKVTIVESKFCSIYFDEDLQLYEQYWHKESEDMEDDDYKKIHIEWVSKLVENQYDIAFFLLDNRENNFSMSPELQEWQAENILAKVLENLPSPDVKVAILQSEDFISQLSIEQAMEENQEADETTRYFDNEVEAKEWLLS